MAFNQKLTDYIVIFLHFANLQKAFVRSMLFTAPVSEPCVEKSFVAQEQRIGHSSQLALNCRLHAAIDLSQPSTKALFLPDFTSHVLHMEVNRQKCMKLQIACIGALSFGTRRGRAAREQGWADSSMD
jgi:hypothetical protein